MSCSTWTQIDFAELLDSYDASKFIHYFLNRPDNILPNSVKKFLKTLQEKEEIIDCLNSIGSKDREQCQAILTALYHFTANASSKVQNVMGLFSPRRLVTAPVMEPSRHHLSSSRKKFFAKDHSCISQEIFSEQESDKRGSISSNSSSSDDLEDISHSQVSPDVSYKN